MSDWYLIAGLGNPGKKYEMTRHNIGFRCADALADRYGLKFSGKTERKSVAADGFILGKKVILAKPQTYMNVSGESLRALVDFYKIEIPRLMVVADDLDIPLGTLRLRKSGSAGGQNGVKSIIQHLGTQDFSRLRYGVGRPPGRQDPASYVLEPFRKGDDEILVMETIDRAIKAIETWLVDGIDLAMTRHNGTGEEKQKPKKAPIVKEETPEA